MAIDMSRFVARFAEEGREHITALEKGIVALEQAPQDTEIINTIFRAAHTLKGSARMLKLLTIAETAHKLEDILGALREGSLSFSGDLGQLLLRAVDGLAVLIDLAAESKPLPDVDAALCKALTEALSGESSAPNAEPIPVVHAPEETSIAVAPKKAADESVFKSGETVRIRLNKLDELIKLMGEVVSSHLVMNQRVVDLKPLESSLLAATLPDSLRSELKAFTKNLSDNVQTQQLLMAELHDKMLSMRMLPLAIVFEPATRLVREIARSVGKSVQCTVSGGEIELDRQMVDRLSDPVIHLIRNALDHGIELPSEREALGKPSQGQVQLSAHQDGNWVVIVIRDDGAGLPLDKIRAKAIAKGLFSEEEAAELEEKTLIDLIFRPGFSTNAIVTDLSGRGVGMDVVHKTIVEDLQGVIDVSSSSSGTLFSLKLPLSLAIMRVLICAVSGVNVGFTAQYVFNLLRVQRGDLIQVAHKQAVIVGNEFIPIISLARLLALKAEPEQRTLLLVVLKTHNQKLAVEIDALVDEQDHVIKPMPAHLTNLTLATGMVMTGNSELVSLLNVPQLMRMATQLRLEKDMESNKSPLKVDAHILVVDDSLNTREIEKDVLEAHGYRVTTAEDGVDGWNKANREVFDAILTDVEMPGMDGFSLTKRLRQEDKFQHTPIIIVTSREKEEDKRRGIEVGADAYIVKGDFEQSNLISTLRNLLG